MFGTMVYGRLGMTEHQVSNISYRLPKNIRPVRYEITLEPRLEPGLNPATFTGAVTIELKVLEKTNNITLHGKQLNLSENTIEILHSSGLKVKISRILRDDLRDFFIFYTESSLMENEIYNMTVGHYIGILNLENKGFYLAKYYDKQGRER